MNTRSLSFRLSCAAALAIAIALGLAAFGLKTIFNQEIERRAAAELGQIVVSIAAQVKVDASGAPSLETPLSDPRFETPYSGLYWQISHADNSARSRSLWDFSLTVPHDQHGDARWTTNLVGPDRAKLLAVVQTIAVTTASGSDARLQIVAALDRSDLAASQQYLFRLLVLSLSALGIILVIAMSIFIRLALRPFDELGRGLRRIHAGSSRTLGGGFPDEVQPVVNDLNRLIAFQDAALERAKTHAADLAHGLKTPLAVLGAVARQARQDDRNDIADPIDEQTLLMSKQVDRVLARARAGVSAALSRGAIPIAPVADKIVRALRRLPDDRGLQWDCDIAADASFHGDDGDLTEMLANLLDNARKWATTRVCLIVTQSDGETVLRVEDDGPGLQTEQMQSIGRGQRWDETLPGTGFGLAITRDLAEAYRGGSSWRAQSLAGSASP
ncbi:ATP-binding protein [Tardiphaga alba]|uniref:ATP-binding protein n=1 Tax=Tardiphaga alba TaxID=340268 RepID=UPI002011A789|nr:HAMP domain-containing sensor histidine kinase [Tardiphaga alba]